MNKFGVTTALLAAAVGIVAIAPKASADEWDKKTIVTISEPMEVPGVVLQPGTYVFKLVRSESDRHIVEIQNERENHTFATIMAIPNYRIQPTGNSVFAFWETPAGQPKALRAWFYPADNFGQEFQYPKRATTQVAKQQVQEAPAPAPAPVVAENTPPPPPEPAPQQEAAPPAPQPEPAPVVVAEAQPPAAIPETSSNLPLFALLGFGSIALALTLGVLAKRIG
jgi:hypothetical protein